MTPLNQQCYIGDVALPTPTIPPDVLAQALLECTGENLSPQQGDWSQRSAELLRKVLEHDELNAKFQGVLDAYTVPVRAVESWNSNQKRIRLRSLQRGQEHNSLLYNDVAPGSSGFSRFSPTKKKFEHAWRFDDSKMRSALLNGWYDGLASPRVIGFDHQSATEEPAFHALEKLVLRTHEIVRNFLEHRQSAISHRLHSFFHPKDDWVVVMRPRALNCSLVQGERGSERIEIVSVISGTHLFLKIWHNSETSDHHLSLADLEASVDEMREVIEATGHAAVTLDRALTFYGAQSSGGISNLDRHMQESFDDGQMNTF